MAGGRARAERRGDSDCDGVGSIRALSKAAETRCPFPWRPANSHISQETTGLPVALSDWFIQMMLAGTRGRRLTLLLLRLNGAGLTKAAFSELLIILAAYSDILATYAITVMSNTITVMSNNITLVSYTIRH